MGADRVAASMAPETADASARRSRCTCTWGYRRAASSSNMPADARRSGESDTATAAPAGETCLKEAAAARPVAARSSEASCRGRGRGRGGRGRGRERDGGGRLPGAWCLLPPHLPRVGSFEEVDVAGRAVEDCEGHPRLQHRGQGQGEGRQGRRGAVKACPPAAGQKRRQRGDLPSSPLLTGSSEMRPTKEAAGAGCSRT